MSDREVPQEDADLLMIGHVVDVRRLHDLALLGQIAQSPHIGVRAEDAILMLNDGEWHTASEWGKIIGKSYSVAYHALLRIRDRWDVRERTEAHGRPGEFRIRDDARERREVKP